MICQRGSWMTSTIIVMILTTPSTSLAPATVSHFPLPTLLLTHMLFPLSDQILQRTRCGTDLKKWQAKHPFLQFPSQENRGIHILSHSFPPQKIKKYIRLTQSIFFLAFTPALLQKSRRKGKGNKSKSMICLLEGLDHLLHAPDNEHQAGENDLPIVSHSADAQM